MVDVLPDSSTLRFFDLGTKQLLFHTVTGEIAEVGSAKDTLHAMSLPGGRSNILSHIHTHTHTSIGPRSRCCGIHCPRPYPIGFPGSGCEYQGGCQTIEGFQH